MGPFLCFNVFSPATILIYLCKAFWTFFLGWITRQPIIAFWKIYFVVIVKSNCFQMDGRKNFLLPLELVAPFGRSHIFCSFSDADNSNSIIKDFLMLVIYFDTTFCAHILRIINNTISYTGCPIWISPILESRQILWVFFSNELVIILGAFN